MNAFFQVGWSLYPSVLIGFGVLTLLYAWVNRGQHTPLLQQLIFHLGTLVGLLALVSPLDEMGDEFLFSAHMIQHLLLIFVTVPLWLIGTPSFLVDEIIPKPLEKSVRLLLAPLPAFLLFTSVIWFWHIPAIYEAAQESETIHVLEHLCFISAALIGWWPVLGPRSRKIPKPDAPLRLLYLFLLAIPCTSLAALLTFADTPLYPFYVSAPHIFGMEVLQDQRLGGLLMWLPTHMILLTALGFTFFTWFNNHEKEEANISYITRDEGTNRKQPSSEVRELGV